MKFIDLTGKKFGELTVIERAANNNNKTMWLCQCSCGNKKIVWGESIKKGSVVSCGCIGKKHRLESRTTHGMSHTKLDNMYYNMKMRCYNKNDDFYKDYGARGIKICDEWLNDRTKFFEWAKNNGYSKSLTIDRINVNGNYEPSNCRFVNAKQQARNRRSNHILEYNGESHTIVEWSEILNVPYSRLMTRINRGWSIEKALTTGKMKNQYST